MTLIKIVLSLMAFALTAFMGLVAVLCGERSFGWSGNI